MRIIEVIFYRFYLLGKALSLNIFPENTTSLLISLPFALNLIVIYKTLGGGPIFKEGDSFRELFIVIFVLCYIGSWFYLKNQIGSSTFEELYENDTIGVKMIGYILVILYMFLSFILFVKF